MVDVSFDAFKPQMWFEFKMHCAKSQTSFSVGEMNVISLESTTENEEQRVFVSRLLRCFSEPFVPRPRNVPGLLHWLDAVCEWGTSVELYVNNSCCGVGSVDDVSLVSVNARDTTAAQSHLG